MPYTLTKGLLWFLLALLIGLVIGWLLRSIRATSQLRAMRAARHDSAELERLRGRVANLEPAVAERDRLQAELAGRNRATSAPIADPLEHAPAVGNAATATRAAPRGAASGGAGSAATEPDVAAGDDVPVSGRVAVVAVVPDDAATETPEPATAGDTEAEPATETETEADAPTPEVAAAAAVLGKPIELDDLTAIEGIDPAIAELCHGIGITTWADLADTEVSLLRTMLADAGPQSSADHPDTWPQQAGLLAAGRWDEFRSLVSTLEGGKLGE